MTDKKQTARKLPPVFQAPDIPMIAVNLVVIRRYGAGRIRKAALGLDIDVERLIGRLVYACQYGTYDEDSAETMLRKGESSYEVHYA